MPYACHELQNKGRAYFIFNVLYDSFTSKYGLLNSRANYMAFSDDSAYCLLCSLEVLDENGNLERKADMFTSSICFRIYSNMNHRSL